MNFLSKRTCDVKAFFTNLIRHLPVTVAYLAAATIVSTILFHFSSNVINISIIFILAIILIARATSCYGAGILASLYSVFWVNFAYTYPYMSLNFSISGYPFTFLGMAFISCFTSSICILLTKQGIQLQEKDRMLMEAEKEAMKANLLRAMSHDLRTPLTTIIGSSATYLEQDEIMTRGEKRKLLQNISEDAQWLLTMVENLLSVTRIQEERGISSVVKSDESVEEVLSEAVQRFHKRFPNTVVHVSVPDAFIMVPMDALLIEQVINNLLENTVFHSGSNGPIDLIAETRDSYLYVSVKDYGNGISPELIGTLFDGGGFSHNQTGDGHKGMGIGLTICKTIIMAHGGTIEASNHNHGAMFTFTLPDWREY
ncbi:MAG: ATP-binding protein [Enterocloster sp.]